jgi:DedD protein
VALVLLAVIVLPMVFDPAPRTSAPPVSVRIPSEDDAGFKPRVTPRVGAQAPQQAPTAAADPRQGGSPEPKPGPVAAATPAPKAPPEKHEKPAPVPPARAAAPAEKQAPAARSPTDEERKRAEDALAGTRFVIPVIALASQEKLNELLEVLRAAKVPHYTEQIATSKGPVTRVRAGPFDSEKAAGEMLEKLKGLGLKPGGVVSKS